jgi:hypothetical protein
MTQDNYARIWKDKSIVGMPLRHSTNFKAYGDSGAAALIVRDHAPAIVIPNLHSVW